MICPKCHQDIQPVTGEDWLPLYDRAMTVSIEEDKPINTQAVLLALAIWDAGAMWHGGMSVLPTELREAIYNVMNKKGRDFLNQYNDTFVDAILPIDSPFRPARLRKGTPE